MVPLGALCYSNMLMHNEDAVRFGREVKSSTVNNTFQVHV
jgi:hypothetical protein